MRKPGLKYKLLSLMDDMPDGGVRLDIIFREYETRYRNEMPLSDFEINSSGNIRWKHSLQGEITECRSKGLLVSPARGYWQITEEGRLWFRNYPNTMGSNVSIPARSSRTYEMVVDNSSEAKANSADHERSNMLEVFSDFFVPLMRILESLPDRAGKRMDVERLFEQTYRDQIVSHQYTRNQRGCIPWEQNVRWGREKLKNLGFVDAPQYGIWRLTEKGHQWLLEHPEATHISPKRGRTTQTKEVYESRKYTPTKKTPSIGKKSDAVEIALEREIRLIREYLAGQSDQQPSNEKLCDWVNFCYILELYAEGQQLFSLVSLDEIHPWYYDKTKKIARICEIKNQHS